MYTTLNIFITGLLSDFNYTQTSAKVNNLHNKESTCRYFSVTLRALRSVKTVYYEVTQNDAKSNIY